MQVRKLRREDLDAVFAIYARARQLMRESGNPNQWKDSHPARELTEGDVENGTGYVIEEGGEIVGVFAFILGRDPTYGYIEGEWLNDEPYGTMHRVAASGKVRGVLGTCLAFCESQIGNVRVDTHADNKIMQHLLEKYGYRKCGIIYIADGSPRIAYQKRVTTN